MRVERNSRKILARLKQDGWVLVGVEGSHHKLRHIESGKTIIVPHPKKDLPTGTRSRHRETCRMVVGVSKVNTYFAVVHKDRDSSFGISFPDLPGCFSAADSEDDLLVQAQLALALFAGDQAVLPSSRSISQLLEDSSVKADIAHGAFLIAIPWINATRKARYNLMLATDLVAGVDRTARSVGMNRSEFVSDALAARLSEQVAAVVTRGGSGSRLTRSESTSKKVASSASKILHDPKASKAAKSVAASALTQKTKKK